MNSTNAIPGSERGYGLRLANGQAWRFVSTSDTSPWVERFASILELKRGAPSRGPRLIFALRNGKRNPQEAPIHAFGSNGTKDLPRAGCQARDLGRITLWSHPEVLDTLCEIESEKKRGEDIEAMRVSLHPIYARAGCADGLPLHGALVGQRGMGVLLAGPPDMGKSTCCRRLPPPWRVLCDDETLVVQDHLKRYRAHPFPTWSDFLMRRSGRRGSVQHSLPLSAVFFLEQAETDGVVSMGQGEAAVRLCESAMEVHSRIWPYLDQAEKGSLRKRHFQNASKLAQTVPAFTLAISRSGRFWDVMERVLL